MSTSGPILLSTLIHTPSSTPMYKKWTEWVMQIIFSSQEQTVSDCPLLLFSFATFYLILFYGPLFSSLPLVNLSLFTEILFLCCVLSFLLYCKSLSEWAFILYSDSRWELLAELLSIFSRFSSGAFKDIWRSWEEFSFYSRESFFFVLKEWILKSSFVKLLQVLVLFSCENQHTCAHESRIW